MTLTLSTKPVHPDMPLPAGAVRVYDWDDPCTPGAHRYFAGSSWVVNRLDDDIDVYIDGFQHHDGSVSREIVVHRLHADNPITVEQARQLAAALLAAADEAEKMNGHDTMVGR